MNIDAYLDRIGYGGSREPSADTLRGLHLTHLYAVPFENLDIHAGREIALDQDRFFEKVVTRRRGGFCYELNGLFSGLLQALGFDVTLLSARVMNDRGEPGAEFDHLTLLVTLKERWLVDVGFGSSFLTPLRLDDPDPQEDGRAAYRVRLGRSERESCFLDRRLPGAGWETQYLFTLTPRRFDEFAGMCRYHQSSPDSPFTRGRVCSMATPEGRVTLRGLTLIVTENGERRERTVSDEREFARLLGERFGMDVRGA